MDWRKREPCTWCVTRYLTRGNRIGEADKNNSKRAIRNIDERNEGTNEKISRNDA